MRVRMRARRMRPRSKRRMRPRSNLLDRWDVLSKPRLACLGCVSMDDAAKQPEPKVCVTMHQSGTHLLFHCHPLILQWLQVKGRHNGSRC